MKHRQRRHIANQVADTPQIRLGMRMTGFLFLLEFVTGCGVGGRIWEF